MTRRYACGTVLDIIWWGIMRSWESRFMSLMWWFWIWIWTMVWLGLRFEEWLVGEELVWDFVLIWREWMGWCCGNGNSRAMDVLCLKFELLWCFGIWVWCFSPGWDTVAGLQPLMGVEVERLEADHICVSLPLLDSAARKSCLKPAWPGQADSQNSSMPPSSE